MSINEISMADLRANLKDYLKQVELGDVLMINRRGKDLDELSGERL